MKFLITGGAGFIGSALIRYIIKDKSHEVINIDKLTYSGNLDSLRDVEKSELYSFRKIDICDSEAVRGVFSECNPDLVINLAAESCVDRSIDDPSKFIETNVVGTYSMLDQARHYWDKIDGEKREKFRFLHVSTDEVFGSLGMQDEPFNESSSYNPSSPYSASKAGSDHLVRAWGKTYGLPVLITNSSNNYGPYQFTEKLIPLIIINAIRGKKVPVYGDGTQVRDWVHVNDHAKALVAVAVKGRVGETYMIGGNNEERNIDIVRAICEILEDIKFPKPKGLKYYPDLIDFVEDRKAHDFRYGLEVNKIKNEVGWKPSISFSIGLKETVNWYLSNEWWWERLIKSD